MPVLKNPRHELMAQELAKGAFITDAHETAGFKRHDSNASKTAARPDIQARVSEIIGNAAKRTEITIASVQEELAKIGYCNMSDYVTIGADGLPFVDMSKVDRAQMAAVQEVHVETTSRVEINEAGEREAVPVRKVRFKLADKRAALVDLGKHLGMFRDQVDLNVTGAVRFIVEGEPPMKTIEHIAGDG
jgi:phage terminase small subunit